jgi:hypothetical protein
MPALGGPLTILPLREGTFGGFDAMTTFKKLWQVASPTGKELEGQRTVEEGSSLREPRGRQVVEGPTTRRET